MISCLDGCCANGSLGVFMAAFWLVETTRNSGAPMRQNWACVRCQSRFLRPARIGGDIQAALLRDLCDTMTHGSLCAMGGMTPAPVLSALEHYPEDFGLSVSDTTHRA
jgi:NADH:ubiquinone oxidoreductase subunit F (NADH-binding)